MKYPIECTDKVVTGDVIAFNEPVFDYPQVYCGDRSIEAEVVFEAGGSVLIRIIESSGCEPLPLGVLVRRRLEEMRRDGIYRQQWLNEATRREKLQKQSETA